MRISACPWAACSGSRFPAIRSCSTRWPSARPTSSPTTPPARGPHRCGRCWSNGSGSTPSATKPNPAASRIRSSSRNRGVRWARPCAARRCPRSRLLFLVRDGRDVVDSLLDAAADGWLTSSLGANIDTSMMRERAVQENARMWVRSVEAVQRAFDAHPPELRLLVTYEELLAATEVEVRRIITWLGRDDALDRVEEVVELLAFSNLPEKATGPGKFPRAATPGCGANGSRPASRRSSRRSCGRPSTASATPDDATARAGDASVRCAGRYRPRRGDRHVNRAARAGNRIHPRRTRRPSRRSSSATTRRARSGRSAT